MSSIDERIVAIKFNNSQFEANIKTTMTSLDGLKKSLNFSAGISALGDLDAAGKKIVGPKLDTTGFNASVKSTVDAANNLKSNLKFDGVTKGLGDLDAAGKRVNLKLDAAGFQAGAKAVVDAASTIKQNLNFESAQRGFGNLKSSVQSMTFESVVTGAQNAARSLGELDLAGKAVDFMPISEGAERAKQSISMMSIAGIAAIASLAVKAASAGADMAKSLFIDPAKSGLAEYELNLGSIQTILANTQSKGSTLGDVNGALDELNAYSDKTIYNFAEMAKNIGTFTSAGVGLKDSTTAIKGISNLAALSGSNSEQASTAMYQLSQAMSTGSVKLQDWNSVVNAGMGGEVFQEALKETARNQGKNVDGLIAQHGSFRDSLQEGWVTDKVMLETLSKMTGDLTDEQLRGMGYGDDQIKKIQEMAVTASDAATKIKTFSQLTGTLTEITGSGWATSWKYILGDFEQAKVMWTRIYDVIGGMVQGTADARNKMLREWNHAGGRQEMIWAVENAFRALMGVLNPVKEAFRSVFPATTGQQLFEITKAIRIFTEMLIPGEQATLLIKNSFALLFTILKIGVDIIKGAFGVVGAFFKAFATGGESIAGSMAPLNELLETIRFNIMNSAVVQDFFIGLNKVATALGTGLAQVVPIVLRLATAIYNLGYNVIGNVMHYTTKFARTIGEGLLPVLVGLIDIFWDVLEVVVHFFEDLDEGWEIATTRLRERLQSIARFGDTIGRVWDSMTNAVSKAWEKILPMREAVAKLFQDIKNEIKNALTDVNFDDTLDVVNTGLLLGLVVLFKGFFKKLTGMGDGVRDGLMSSITTSFDSINGVLEQLTGTLGAMQQNLQADTLQKIAIAIGIMAISVVALSFIDSGKLTKALIAIAVMVVILGKAMEMLDKISVGSGFLKIPFIAASMILLAIALGLLVIPVVVLSKLSWGELIKGLFGISIMLLALSKTVESMAKNPADLIATGVGLMAIAIAVKILADAVVVMGALDLGSLIKGLAGVAIVLYALTKTVESMSKNPADLIVTGLGIVAIAIAIKILASAVGDFGSMDIPTIIQGIVALAIVLTLLQNFAKGVGDVKEIVQTAVAMVIIAAAMKLLASALSDLGNLSLEVLAKGLGAMAISLLAITRAFQGVPEKEILAKAASFVIIALALKILASALADMGNMSIEQIGKSLVVLAASLVIISVALNMLADPKVLAGAGAIFIIAAGLAILAPVLVQLGNMSWEQIGMGMAALAAVFIIFGLAGLVLGPIVPVLFSLGVAIGMLGLGLMGIGLGVALFAAGLMIISSVVLATGPALILFVGSILALIPLAMMELGKGIVAFAGVIGNAMPIFLDAFVKLLITLLTAIDIVFPKLMETLWTVIVGLVALLVRGIPLFVDAGMKIIIGILTGIGNNIGQMADAAAKIIVEFLNGISRNIRSIIDAGVNLVISFIEGMARSVRENSTRMSNAGLDLAEAIIQGMVNGIGAGVNRVIESAKAMAGDALNAAKKMLGIASPSKEFFAIGRFVDMGFSEGIRKYAGLAVNSTEAMGAAAMDVLKKTMSNIGGEVSKDMEMAPVIRPVLDLSAVKRDSGLVAGMLTAPSLEIDTMYAKAATLAVQARQNNEANTANSEEAVTSSEGETNVTFIQNNNSPKALSSVDIYRKTKNQLSKAKEVLGS